MVRRKLSGRLGITIGISAFILGTGIITTPAFADDTILSVDAKTNVTTSAAVAIEKDYSININKSAEQNGVKVTVDKALATKHKLKVVLKIQSEKSLEKMKHEQTIFELTYGNQKFHGHTNSPFQYIDGNTMLVTLEKDNYENEYPKTGEMRVDVVLSEFKVNIGMDIPVDFSESFNNVIEKDLSGKVPEFDYTLKSLEADAMGTRISYTKPQRNDEIEGKEDYKFNSKILLKAGDKIYRTESNGTFSGENNVRSGNYEAKTLTYDKIKDEKEVSLIPLICNISWKELSKLHQQDRNDTNLDTMNNVSYEKSFNFNDGSKGEIYNIERNDNSIKVYCKGESEMKSLLIASNLSLHYEYVKGKNDNSFYRDENVVCYKDSKEKFGYIVEFNNVEKEKKTELSFEGLIKNIDRYKLMDEIKLIK
jgi:hypothetical protein